MAEALNGVIHGRTIELNADPGLADGEAVEVVIRAAGMPGGWGEGLLRSAGAMAAHWTEEDDLILEAIRRDRRDDARPEPGESATCSTPTPAPTTSSIPAA